jgi:C-5 cytosine-specific DNA methylase
MTKRQTGIELFAGCGGLSTGFLDAGLNVAAGFELDARAVDAYNYNHQYRGSRGFLVDLKFATGIQLLNLAKIERADFVIGGPPCQPFSIAGKRQGTRDVRADLIGHYVRIVGELRPCRISPRCPEGLCLTKRKMTCEASDMPWSIALYPPLNLECLKIASDWSFSARWRIDRFCAFRCLPTG